MCHFLQLMLSSALLWLYLQTTFFLVLDLFYLSVPWLSWGAIILFLLIRFGLRVPPPDEKIVEKVLGIDPLTLNLEEEEEEEINIYSEKETLDKVDDKFCIRTIAHRGAGFDYPENSMSAFHNSFSKGCDAIEFDLMLTKDNVPIIFHDVNIDRLTGSIGTVNEMTWDSLKDYDISINHPLRVKFDPEGERIALFEDVIKEGLKNDTRMFIDIKATGKEVVKVILNAFKNHPELYEKAAITSFNPTTIYMIRKKDPLIVAGLSWRPQIFSMCNYCGKKGPRESRFDNLFMHVFVMLIDTIHDWAINRITYYVLGLSFIMLHKDTVNADNVRLWNDRGIRVFAWSINLPHEKLHFLKNLKVSILTDTLLS